MATKKDKKIIRKNRILRYVPLGKMKVAEYAQRKMSQKRVDYLVANLDLDEIGTPEVSARDGHYFIMDGQHRIRALIQFLGDGWETQEVQCWVSNGLKEKEEAEIFLRMNDALPVNTFEKFKVALRAGRPMENAIEAVVNDVGLHISEQISVPGAVACVGALKRSTMKTDLGSLRRGLNIIVQAYGDPGLKAAVIEGMSMLCHRYNGKLNDSTAIQALSGARGGVNGLLGAAEQLRQKTAQAKGPCVAAAAVSIINRGKGGKKLPGWWKD